MREKCIVGIEPRACSSCVIAPGGRTPEDAVGDGAARFLNRHVAAVWRCWRITVTVLGGQIRYESFGMVETENNDLVLVVCFGVVDNNILRITCFSDNGNGVCYDDTGGYLICACSHMDRTITRR